MKRLVFIITDTAGSAYSAISEDKFALLVNETAEATPAFDPAVDLAGEIDPVDAPIETGDTVEVANNKTQGQLNTLKPTSTTGSVISFTNPKVYNTFSTPASGAITHDLTDAKILTPQKIYHMDSSMPTVPSGWIKTFGEYQSSVLNIIVAEWCIASRVEYQISQASSLYYVRPAGGSYGTEDGTSYANAWNGFANIDWGLVESNSLAVCGTHEEMLEVQSNNVNIYGNDVNEAGVIDGLPDTVNSNIKVTNYTGVYIEGIVSLRAVLDGIFINGTSIVTTKNCTFSECGNQGIQHYDTAIGYHYNPLCEDNTDDGVSAHHDSVFYVFGGNLNNNAEGINMINDTRGYVYGTSFSGNTSQDVRVISESLATQCILEISDCTIGIIDVSANAKIIVDNCIISNLKVGNGAFYQSYAELTNCEIAEVNNGNLVDETFTNCSIQELKKPATSTANIIRLYDSYCKFLTNFNYTGTFIARRSFLDCTGSTYGVLDMQGSSTTDVAYCVFKNPIGGKFAATFRASAIITRFDNNTIDGVNAGSGVFSLVAHTFNNLIIYDCNTGIQASSVTLITNNCCFFSNTNNTLSTVTQNSSQTTDPLFVNTATKDYTLGVGSPCLNNGITAVETIGIQSANWNADLPNVVELAQSGSWDIGAYLQ